MTPANIVGMAVLKGLDVIALTDHNSCKNCPAFMAAAKEYEVLAIPGMELCTVEEVHAVCLFKTLESAMKFDEYVSMHLIPFPNQPDIFGKQEIYDEMDRICGTEQNLLINATDISFEGLWELVRSYDGVMFPAHIDKNANSLLSNLGFVPPDSKFATAELKEIPMLLSVCRKNPYLERCRIISNSDAHVLQDIKEPGLSIWAEERTAEGVISALGTFESA